MSAVPSSVPVTLAAASVVHWEKSAIYDCTVASVVVRGVSLKTEDRAARRAEWDKWKREKEQKVAEKKQERAREERLADEAEMKRLRQLTVHHARPVPLFIRQRKKSDRPFAE